MLSPSLVVTLLLYMVGDANRRGYSQLLEAFWDECADHGLQLPVDEPVSAAAFCQARAKISTDMLRCALRELSSRFEESFREHARWSGRRVFAVDGSKLNLQRSAELDTSFGRQEQGYCPQATVSLLLNVCSRVASDVVIDKYAACERSLLLEHLEYLQPGDILVLDRGYPSHTVLRALVARGIDFLVRVPATSSFGAVNEFLESGGDDRRVVVRQPNRPANLRPLEVRAVRLTNAKGEVSVYLTSLRRAQFSRQKIRELYRMRWEAEEFFKTAKADYFSQRQFHARGAHGVRQEILAQVLFAAIARFLLAIAAREASVSHDLSMKAGVLATAHYLTRILLGDLVPCLPRMIARLARAPRVPRPGRSFPRRSFKPRSKWSPRGRAGA